MSPPTDDERHRFRQSTLHAIYGSHMTGSARRTDWLAHAGRAVLAFSVAVPAIELWRIGVFDSGADLAVAIIATAAYLPLHLRHVYYGLQGGRPRGAIVTLGLMAAV